MGLSSPWHWIIVLIIVVLIFGTKKLKNIGKDLGTAVHDFKEGINEGSKEEEIKKAEKIIENKSENNDKQA